MSTGLFELLDEALVYHLLVEYVDCRSLVYLAETCHYFYDMISGEDGVSVSDELLYRISPLLYNKHFLHGTKNASSKGSSQSSFLLPRFSPRFSKQMDLRLLHMQQRTEKLHAINFYAEIRRAKRQFMVSCGADHTIVLKSNSQLMTFGKNTYGQLGTGNTDDSEIPRFISLPIEDYDLNSKSTNSMSLDSDVGCSEYNLTVQSVVGGDKHSIVLLKNGTIFGFGDNSHGQLGPYLEQDKILTPRNILFPKIKQQVSMISCAKDYSCLVLDDAKGTVLVLGTGLPCERQPFILDNNYDELVRGEISASEKVVEASAGFHHLLMITECGKAFSVGSNSNGQLGTERIVIGPDEFALEPVMITFDYKNFKVFQVAAGERHSMLLTRDGEIYTFGSNGCGQLGLSTFAVAQALPKKVKLPSNCFPIIITCGNQHSIILDINGQLLCAGSNEFGQTLSSSAFFASNKFTTIQTGCLKDAKLQFRKMSHIAAGNRFTAVLGSARVSENIQESKLVMFGLGEMCGVSATSLKSLGPNRSSIRPTCVLPMEVNLNIGSRDDSELILRAEQKPKIFYNSRFRRNTSNGGFPNFDI